MPVVNIKQLHDDTSAVIREVAKGKSFEVEKHGKIVTTIRPVQSAELPSWSEILAPVRALQRKAKGKIPNPVLAERARRRR